MNHETMGIGSTTASAKPERDAGELQRITDHAASLLNTLSSQHMRLQTMKGRLLGISAPEEGDAGVNAVVDGDVARIRDVLQQLETMSELISQDITDLEQL